MTELRTLTSKELAALASQGCSAEDWTKVAVGRGFDALRVRRTHFGGAVTIGSLAGAVRGPHGIEKPAAIEDAVLIDVRVGDDCRIARVGVHIAGYDIGDGACLEDVGTLHANPGAAFGNGVAVEALNEGGGREVAMFNELSAQWAYLMCLHRYRPAMIERLAAIAKAEATAASGRGSIGAGASITSVREIIDVCVGPHARIAGAASLANGTILSTAVAPALVGAGVVAKDFIIGEASSVTDGAILARTFVGQGCRIGKQFSAENCLFFANCEAFHGEACAIFAGPYSVTHHKSSLLIAGLFSFYNAGSGTNQSNHMYKLGPVHEGKLGRGCKTGSFAYLMWPCRAGPFSVIMGKHAANFDTWCYPFSHIEARPDGKTYMIPGLNLTTVGTVRDGAKWPSRDRRTGAVRRDRITFDVLSPFTVGLMMRGRAALAQLLETTDKAVEEVPVGGTLVKRPILRTGQKNYRNAIELYLYEQAFLRAEAAAAGGREAIREALAVPPHAVYSAEWVDIAGLLMPVGRLRDLEHAIEQGRVADVPAFAAALDEIARAYADDAWAWTVRAFREAAGGDLCDASSGALHALAVNYLAAKRKFLKLVLADAEREFEAFSRTGFGMDGGDEETAGDFAAVRGAYDRNKFVKEMQAALDALERRVSAFKARIGAA